MLRIMLSQRTTEKYDNEIIEASNKVAEGFETDGFHVSPMTNSQGRFFVSVTSKDATLTMGEMYSRDVIAKVQSVGIPLVIAQVRFNRETGDPS